MYLRMNKYNIVDLWFYCCRCCPNALLAFTWAGDRFLLRWNITANAWESPIRGILRGKMPFACQSCCCFRCLFLLPYNLAGHIDVRVTTLGKRCCETCMRQSNNYAMCIVRRFQWYLWLKSKTCSMSALVYIEFMFGIFLGRKNAFLAINWWAIFRSGKQ